MPIIDVQLVVDTATDVPKGCAKALADGLGKVLDAAPSRLWLRLELLTEDRYAENGSTERALPVFVRVLHADLPPQHVLVTQSQALATVVAACLNRNPEQVHIEYAQPGRGRVAFGGKLLC
jgi:hypothetical protein